MNHSPKYDICGSSDKKKIICYLLREFYRLGWATGSGGGISIREDQNTIWIAPSGVHKEFVQEEDLFLMDLQGNVLNTTNNPKLRCSECTPLFLQAFNIRNAGAVLHSHSINALLITKLFGTEFQCTDLEMIKGIIDHKNTDWCRIPIVENTEFEPELTESLKNAIVAYPRSHAVLVRNHGIYIWGPTWEKAKIHAECYEYLFKAVLKMHKYNLPIPNTISSDKQIRSWKIDPSRNNEDLRNDLHYREPQWVSVEDLKKVGVLVWKLSGSKDDPELVKICTERKYKNRDEKEIGKQLPNYDEMIKTFATEHLHADEEIRYVLKGSGYFDVRNKDDEWLRIQVTRGDLIILPEGIYHRYVADVTNYIHVMRLFQEEPKWLPINRPCDDHESRKRYIKLFFEN
jgi:methylthioribulose-1-phosphate dehydratase